MLWISTDNNGFGWRMRQRSRLAHLLYIVLLVLACLPVAGLAAPSKTLICHYPPDNPVNRNILNVGTASLADHLSHGDNVLGEEVCDLVDNDCDGQVDEDEAGDPLINPTTCGVGECSGNTGFETCENGQFVNDTCNPFEGASAEVCDTLDNDCDGPSDEDSSGNPLTQATTCGVGECAGNTGFETCIAGNYGSDTCNPFDGALPEICDGDDNDCNGVTDEAADMCAEAQICDGANGCIVDPSLTCPCDADLIDVSWADGGIPFGGCVSDDGDGYPWYGLVAALASPYTTHFILDAFDVEPDGVREYTCVAGMDDDGTGGNPVVWWPTRQVSESELLGCSVRMNPGAAQNVVDCLTE
jgi:hypothetical protein